MESAGDVEVPLASDDAPSVAVSDALSVQHKRLQVVSRKLKEKCDQVSAELVASQARVAELEVAARAAADRSALAALLGGGDGGGEARVAARVPVADAGGGAPRLWVCAVSPDGGRADWIPEDDLLSRAPRFSAAVRQCEAHLTPGEGAALRARAAEPAEELRKYRVRVEALLRQRDAELASARERAAAAEAVLGGSGPCAGEGGDGTGNAGGGGGAGDASGVATELRRRLAEASAQAQRLYAARGEMLERERAAKDAEEEALREAALARADAAAWQARWEEAVGAPAGGSGGGGGGGAGAAAAAAAAAATAASEAAAEARAPLEAELAKMQGEYSAYRKRAVAMMKERDEQMRRMGEELSAVRAARAAARSEGDCGGHRALGEGAAAGGGHFLSPVGGGGGGGGGGGHVSGTHAPPPPFSPGGTPDASRWLYLRALLLRFLSEGDGAMRASLEPPLFTVLALTPVEVAAIARARAAASGPGAAVGQLVAATGAPAGVAEAASDLVNGTVSSVGSLLGAGLSLLGAAAGAITSGTAPPAQEPPPPAMTRVTLLRQ